ncbi:hypothetical protein ['Camptotheca acuminata' phytoplasma]|uniref:hypothetical protein n=1 Tax='Camptotheca acuminata' phytoplasma TaxID=3239192 RepID=UPI00351A77B7
MMLLTYDQLVDFLKTKYGEVPGNYFLNFSFTETNHDIKRSNEGLEIHHIMEYKKRRFI